MTNERVRELLIAALEADEYTEAGNLLETYDPDQPPEKVIIDLLMYHGLSPEAWARSTRHFPRRPAEPEPARPSVLDEKLRRAQDAIRRTRWTGRDRSVAEIVGAWRRGMNDATAIAAIAALYPAASSTA